MPGQLKFPSAGGIGLDLSAARGITGAPGGAANSARPGGAAVALGHYRPTAGRDAESARSPPRSALSNYVKILVIDDDKLFVELVRRMLRKTGFAAVAATDPEAALRRVRKNPAEFDVIITDQVMPRQSGLDLAAAIRELRPNLPIILLTGNENFCPLNGRIRDEVNLCLNKPIDMQTLAEAVREVTAAL